MTGTVQALAAQCRQLTWYPVTTATPHTAYWTIKQTVIFRVLISIRTMATSDNYNWKLIIRQTGDNIRVIADTIYIFFKPRYERDSERDYLEHILYSAFVLFLPKFLEQSFIPKFLEIVAFIDAKRELAYKLDFPLANYRSEELLRLIEKYEAKPEYKLQSNKRYWISDEPYLYIYPAITRFEDYEE